MLYALWNQIFCSLLILPESLQVLLIHLMYKFLILQFLIVQVSLPQLTFLETMATYSSHSHTHSLSFKYAGQEAGGLFSEHGVFRYIAGKVTNIVTIRSLEEVSHDKFAK